MPSNDTTLSPIDNLEHIFKDSLPEKEYGEWSAKAIELDDQLQLLDKDTVNAFAETAQKQILAMLRFENQAIG